MPSRLCPTGRGLESTSAINLSGQLIALTIFALLSLILMAVSLAQTSWYTTMHNTRAEYEYAGPVYAIGPGDVTFGWWRQTRYVNRTSGCVVDDACEIVEADLNVGTCIQRCPWAFLPMAGEQFFGTCNEMARTMNVATTAGCMSCLAMALFICAAWVSVKVHRLFAETTIVFAILGAAYGFAAMGAVNYAVHGEQCGGRFNEQMIEYDNTFAATPTHGGAVYMVVFATTFMGWVVLLWESFVSKNAFAVGVRSQIRQNTTPRPTSTTPRPSTTPRLNATPRAGEEDAGL